MVTAKAADVGRAARFGLPALRLPARVEVTDDFLAEIGALNDCWRFERTAEGALAMTLPSFPLSSGIHADLGYQLFGWSLEVGAGRVFDAELGIALLDGSLRMPDAAWFDAAQAAEIDEGSFVRGAPAFVLEVRSSSQSIEQQQEQMEVWMANGSRLGWLVDPFEREVWVYREGVEGGERVGRPMRLGGEGVLEGFVATFERIWG